MNVQIEESWKAHLQPEFEKDYFRTLTEFVKSEYSQYTIYPPGKLIFNAFNLCPFDKVKVVIIGQVLDRQRRGPRQIHLDRRIVRPARRIGQGTSGQWKMRTTSRISEICRWRILKSPAADSSQRSSLYRAGRRQFKM